jgi:hypothetical protein
VGCILLARFETMPLFHDHFEFYSHPCSGGFWLAISFRFRLINCQLGCYRVFLINVRSGEVGTLITTLYMSTTCSRIQARAGAV